MQLTDARYQDQVITTSVTEMVLDLIRPLDVVL